MNRDRWRDWQEEPIVLVEYDPEWPDRFAAEVPLIDHAIGQWITGGIHHVGSTAVPGLTAKPIIDILVGVADLVSARQCIEPLAPLQYLHAPYLPDQMLWFCKPHPAHRTHHLHLVPADSPRFAAEIAFRDQLRGHPEVARTYAQLKRELAVRFRDDREAYTAGKSDFVTATTARALAGGT